MDKENGQPHLDVFRVIYTNTYQESILPTYSDITFVKCPILRSRNKRKCAFYQYVRTLTPNVRSKGRYFLWKNAHFPKIIFLFAKIKQRRIHTVREQTLFFGLTMHR